MDLNEIGRLEMKMATHSSILAWEISRTEELGRRQAMRSQANEEKLAITINWKEKNIITLSQDQTVAEKVPVLQAEI